MKVCHITSGHSRYDARIFRKQCRTLAQNGIDTVLVCCDGKGEEKKDGVQIVSYSDHSLSKKERFRLLFDNQVFLKYLLSLDADIYQFHELELLEIGRLLKKNYRKVIFDSHENWKEHILGLLPNVFLLQRIFRYLFDLYYGYVLKKFDAIFSVSPNMVNELLKYNTNVYFVSNYPIINDTEEFIQSSFNTNTFVYAGTVYEFSNQLNITKAIQCIDYQSASYLIIGNIDNKLKEAMLSFDNSHKLSFVSWITPEDLRKRMSQGLAGMVLFDYVPFCCNREGQMGSNKIFEYMQIGLPVICTDFLLWEKLIIDKYDCGISVSPNNLDEIVKAMKFLIENKSEAKRMGENGRFAVLNEFNWEKGVEEYLNNYYKIIANNI